jgi:hypothetical protein
MTLILVLGNEDQFIQISDRKLSVLRGKLTEEANKGSFLQFSDARLLFGYTGLARTKGFDADRWLEDTLLKCGPPDFLADRALNRFTEIATKDFSSLPTIGSLNPVSKRFCVMFVGFLYSYIPPLGIYALISNFHNMNGQIYSKAQDKFVFIHKNELRPTGTFLDSIGNNGAFTKSQMVQLKALLLARRPANAIADKAIEIMLEIANSPQSENTVGKQFNIIYLPRNHNEEPSAAFYSDTTTYTDYTPNAIWITPWTQSAFSNISFSVADPASAPPLAGPRLSPNQLCWCGSGKKYKWCHGKKQRISKRKHHSHRV